MKASEKYSPYQIHVASQVYRIHLVLVPVVVDLRRERSVQSERLSGSESIPVHCDNLHKSKTDYHEHGPDDICKRRIHGVIYGGAGMEQISSKLSQVAEDTTQRTSCLEPRMERRRLSLIYVGHSLRPR